MKFDPLAALSLIYVFIFLYNSIIYGAFDAFMAADVPPAVQKKENERYLRQKQNLLFFRLTPFVFLNFGILYVCFPTLVNILSESNLNLVHFDIGNTLFCILILLQATNTIFAISWFIRVIRKS